jgi:RNA polymerase primary sigma factor
MLSGFITEEEKKEIQKELLEGNLRFVITVSKQYQNQGLDLPDLIAEGNLGLMKAIENFDWTKKLRFISYGVWWVRQSILQSLNENARTIRLPVNVVQELHKAKKELEKDGVELPEKFANLPYTINLENPLNEEGDTLLDIINNPNAELADANLSTEQTLKDKLLSMLDVLDEREKVIIQDYFGLSGSTRTLEDIGNDFDLTKERVRQIKEKALRKLRNETGILFDYL